MIPVPGKSADTVKIHLTYKHKLSNNGQSRGYLTINQKLYTFDGELFREIKYNETNSQIDNYIFYFYKNGRLSSKEQYNGQDSLNFIDHYEYNTPNLVSQITRYQLIDGKLLPIQRTVTLYNQQGKPTSVKIIFGKKTGKQTTCTYNDKGLLLNETTKFKQAAKDTLKLLNKSYTYNLNGRIEGIVTTVKNSDNKTFVYSETCSYNEKGLLTQVRKSDSNNNLLETIRYSYLNSGALSIYEVKNQNGLVTELMQYDYKKHYMERGTQVSRYENF